MATQLITITPDGTVKGLQFKRERGFDLRSLGNAKIERSSLIEWSEREQGWYIRLLKAGQIVSDGLCKHTLGLGYAFDGQYRFRNVIHEQGLRCTSQPMTLLFDEYEDAVAAEVKLIQTIRKQKGVDAV